MEDNPEGMEVDIGYMPLMELVSRGRSRPSAADESTDNIETIRLKVGFSNSGGKKKNSLS